MECNQFGGTTAILAEAIQELKEVPSGLLYAQVMEHITFDAFTAAISDLIKGGLIEKSGYFLKWIGEKTEVEMEDYVIKIFGFEYIAQNLAEVFKIVAKDGKNISFILHRWDGKVLSRMSVEMIEQIVKG